MDEWPVVDTRVEYENPYFRVCRETVRRPDGTAGEYYWLDQTDDVCVVALTDEGDLALVEQYRPRLRGTFLECPSGKCESGESPERAAARELEEETGYRAGRLDVLRSYHVSGWERNRKHVVFATDLAPGEQSLDAGEGDIAVRHLAPEDALARARESPVVGWLLTPLLVARDAGLL
ncbi:NUDIX hydrolase [Halomarina litorea]|uniref:NUDIX hydrolase n=1 Tax=Halomarina litorea TaxID=2961595 RepID=UPI0020C1E492|nr:NUDIX hydrolase [Halomarina sp. BCD28]